LLALQEDGRSESVSWNSLRDQVAGLAQFLRGRGVRPGDRVVGYLPNTPHAVVALLASAAVGAVWSCCPPDYGTRAVIDRFAQLKPAILLAVDGYRFGGQVIDRSAESAEIAAALSTLTDVVYVDNLGSPAPDTTWVSWRDALVPDAELAFEQVAFDHPLWVLYSSGTTGLPKGLVHGHGGIVLEHLKWLGLHNDIGDGDVFFWYTSTAWMIWNVVVGSLLRGATAVLYDGSPIAPERDALWKIVSRTKTTHFGTSAGYLTLSRKCGLTPGDSFDLGSLRCILSTGSPLPLAGWQSVYDAVKPDVWLDAPSGGTDVCVAFVGGNPMLPVRAGRMQCRLLGADVQAWNDAGEPVIGEVGELVVAAPTPSMPLYFVGDADGSRYHDAYFDVFPGIWRHGDWILITEDGSAEIHGRSDSTINRHGVRMGSADIYAAVESVDEVFESLVVGAELPQGDYYMPLFVVLGPGNALDDALRAVITDRIRSRCSARHVPDEIIEVAAIPHTLTGKRLEVPVKRLIQGTPLERAVNSGVVDRPDVLPFFAELGARRRRGEAYPKQRREPDANRQPAQ
jgi:acetoacetyl-CoA synthetase